MSAHVCAIAEAKGMVCPAADTFEEARELSSQDEDAVLAVAGSLACRLLDLNGCAGEGPKVIDKAFGENGKHDIYGCGNPGASAVKEILRFTKEAVGTPRE